MAALNINNTLDWLFGIGNLTEDEQKEEERKEREMLKKLKQNTKNKANMERKIGDIFEHNGEWYQCIIGHCNQCCFDEAGTCKFIGDPYCAYRNDKKLACFKKLDKVGEPYFNGQYGEVLQEYKYYIPPITPDLRIHIIKLGIVGIEIKQNKEDMEEKNLKPFDLEAAKAGKPICTRDGRKARIICFDAKFPKTGNIVTLVEKENGEEVTLYHYDDGHCSIGRDYDLMMLPEKKEGWVNVYKDENNDDEHFTEKVIYKTRKDAFVNACPKGYVKTVKISW